MNPSAEHGQTMTEYAVVLAIITLGVMAAVVALSGTFVNILDSVVAILQ